MTAVPVSWGKDLHWFQWRGIVFQMAKIFLFWEFGENDPDLLSTTAAHKCCGYFNKTRSLGNISLSDAAQHQQTSMYWIYLDQQPHSCCSPTFGGVTAKSTLVSELWHGCKMFKKWNNYASNDPEVVSGNSRLLITYSSHHKLWWCTKYHWHHTSTCHTH